VPGFEQRVECDRCAFAQVVVVSVVVVSALNEVTGWAPMSFPISDTRLWVREVGVPEVAAQRARDVTQDKRTSRCLCKRVAACPGTFVAT
jgi:hypothetical protein